MNMFSKFIQVAVVALIAVCVMPPALSRADQNWDGDNAVGNFSFNNNWFGDSQPGWGFGNGSLHFSFRNNSAQTSLFFDYSSWVDTNDIIFDSTFGASTPLNGNGNGINFNQRLENDSSFAQTINIPLSGAKNGAGQIELNPVNGDLTINGTIFNDNNKSYHVFGNNGKSLTVNSTLGGDSTVSFTNENNNLVVFGANQSYGGGTFINGGSVTLGTGGTAGSAGSGGITIGGGFTLAFNRSDSPTFSNAITLGGASGSHDFLTVTSGTSAKLTGSITSTSGAEFWKSGAGTLIVNHSSNTFNTSVVIQAGELSTDSLANTGGGVNNSSLGVGGIFIGQGGSGTLTYTGATATTDRIGASALQGTSNTINISNSGTNLTISSGIGQTGAANPLTKDGSGSLTLAGTNSYTGSTTVKAGSLFVTGSTNSSSAITVNNSGTLGGGNGATAGNIGGSVTVQSGGNLAPGATGNGSTGILNTGALTLNSSSNFSIDLNGSTAGSGYDQVSVAGTVSLLSGANLLVTAGNSLSLNQTFTIVQNDSTDAISGTFAQGSSVMASNNGDIFSINYAGGDGNDISLTLIAIPEPSTWIPAGLALLTLAYAQRRRISRSNSGVDD